MNSVTVPQDTHKADTEKDKECLIPGYQLQVHYIKHYPEQALACQRRALTRSCNAPRHANEPVDWLGSGICVSSLQEPVARAPH